MTAFPLSERYKTALNMAFDLHQNQARKGSPVPYFAHLMSVSALVLENGGSENQAIAALLHDAAEDQGGYATLETIRAEFGEEVAEIVDGLTDSYTQPKAPWLGRKTAYLERLKMNLILFYWSPWPIRCIMPGPSSMTCSLKETRSGTDSKVKSLAHCGTTSPWQISLTKHPSLR